MRFALILTVIGYLLGFAIGSTIRPASHLLGAKECTWGPSYWCQNITTSSQCRATKHCIQTTWIHQKLPVDLTSVCQTCLEMVKEARDQLLSNETQEEIKEVFEGSCKLLPVKVVSKECCKLADEFIPDLVDTLASQMDPQVVCSVAGLCNNERVRQLLKQEDAIIIKTPLNKDDPCTSCFEVVKKVEDNFRSSTPQEISTKFLDFCRKMGTYSESCSNFVALHFNNLHKYISENLNPKDVCHLVGECSDQYHSHANVRITPLSGIGVVLNKDHECDQCQAVISSFKKFLILDTNEDEFHIMLTGMCNTLTSFKHECLALVDEHYSNLYKFISELQEEEACSVFGFCSAPGFQAISGPIQPLLPVETIQNQQLSAVPINRINTNKVELESPESLQLPIERIMPQTLTIIGNTQLCEFCEYFLHFVQQALTDPKTEDSIRHVVDEACDRLPSSINDTCRQFVDTYGPAFVAILAQDIDPSVVCPKLSLCPSQEVSNVEILMKHNTGNKPNCPLCLFSITSLKEYIQNKKTESNIRKELGELCSHLSTNLREECEDFVNTYTNEIVEALLADLDPAEVCEYLKLCQDKTPVKKVNVKIEYPSRDDLFETVDEPVIHSIDQSVMKQSRPEVWYGGEIETNEIPDSTLNGKDATLSAGSEPCVLCEFVMSQIKQQLQENSTEDEIKTIVHNICGYMPKSVKKECNQFVNQYADAVIELLIQSLEPNEICAELKFCKSTQGINAIDIKGNLHSLQCSLCKIVMNQVEHMLQGKITENDVIKAVHTVCSSFPSQQSTECKEFIDKNGKRIIELLEVAIQPSEICSLMFFCTSQFNTIKLEIRKCSVCESAVDIMKEILGNPNVDHIIEHVLEKTCRAVSQKYRNLCHNIIDVYGNEIFEMLTNNTNPRIICNSLGLCGSQVSYPVFNSQLVGANKCTWGPSYWCANEQTANECEALQHCQEKVWSLNPIK